MDKAEQVRQLLSSYYGDYQDDQGDDSLGTLHSEPPSSVPSTALPPRPSMLLTPAASKMLSNVKAIGIDSAAFDADTYVATMRREQRLAALLSKYTQVSTEVRTLDSDMQMLIYENYNQFIAALDAIKGIRSKTQSMEDGMHELQQRIDAFAQGSHSVNTTLQHRRHDTEQLTSIHRLLHALQATLALPDVLQGAVQGGDEGDVAVAVQQYATLAPLLRACAHKGVFRKVSVRVETLRQRLVTLLMTRLATGVPPAGPPSTHTVGTLATTPCTATHTPENQGTPQGTPQHAPPTPTHSKAVLVGQLAALGEGLESLFEELLAGYADRMTVLLQEARGVLDIVASRGGRSGGGGVGKVGNGGGGQGLVLTEGVWCFEAGPVPPVPDFVKELCTRFVNDTQATAQLAREGFTASTAGTAEEVHSREATLARAMEDAAQGVVQCIRDTLQLCARGLVQEQEQWMMHRVGVCIDRHEPRELSVGGDWGVGVMVDALEAAHGILSLQHTLGLTSVLTETTLTMIRNVVQDHCAACVQSLARCMLFTILPSSSSSPTPPLSSISPSTSPPTLSSPALLLELYRMATQLSCTGVEGVLKALRRYDRLHWLMAGWGHTWAHWVQHCTSNMLQGVLGALLVHTGVPPLPIVEDVEDDACAPGGDPAWVTAIANTQHTAQPTSIPPGSLLLASRTIAMLGEVAVPHALEVLATQFPDTSTRGPRNRGRGAPDVPPGPPPFQAMHLARSMQRYAQAMLSTYVLQQGTDIAEEITQRIWHHTPRGPGAATPPAQDITAALSRTPIESMLQTTLQQCEQEVAQLIDDGGLGGGMAHQGGDMDVHRTRESNMSALERHVARLFHHHVRVFHDDVEATQIGVLEGIVNTMLKALVEEVRCSTLTRAQAEALDAVARSIGSVVQGCLRGRDSQPVAQLLEELLHSVEERVLGEGQDAG